MDVLATGEYGTLANWVVIGISLAGILATLSGAYFLIRYQIAEQEKRQGKLDTRLEKQSERLAEQEREMEEIKSSRKLLIEANDKTHAQLENDIKKLGENDHKFRGELNVFGLALTELRGAVGTLTDTVKELKEWLKEQTIRNSRG